jgi:hypothetical protein
MVAFSFDTSYFLMKFILIFFDRFVYPVLDLSVQMDRHTSVIFELSIAVFYLLLGISHHFVKLLHPFGDDAENRWRLDKKDAVLYFRFGVLRCIFADLSAY